MSEIKELKQRIYNDTHVEKILEELGCDDIKYEQQGSLLTARPPSSSNRRALQVRLTPSLNAYVRNEGVEGDIFAIIAFCLYGAKTFEEVKENLYQVRQWIYNTLQYDDFDFWNEVSTPKVDWNYWLRPIQQQREKGITLQHNSILDESILNEYVTYPWQKWINEGLSYSSQKFYGIGYDVQSERVTIPVRNKDGKLIGVKGRYVGSDKEIKSQYKYIYLHPCNKSIEIFNIHNALPYIKEQKECFVFEAAKTVMMAHSCGIYNCVSIEGDRLSPVQARLIKEMGIDVEPIFCWDKDKDEIFIKEQTKQIKGRKMSYLFDKNDIFSDPKASPLDEGKEKFLRLYKGCKYKL